MLKTIFYLGLTALGVVLTLISPIWGVVLNLGTYLLNPEGLTSEVTGFRFQLVAALSLILSLALHRPKTPVAVGGEGGLMTALWAYVGVTFVTSLWAVYSMQLSINEATDFAKTVLVSFLFIFAIRTDRDMSLVVWTCLIGVAHGAFMHVIGTKIGFFPEHLGWAGEEKGVVIEYQGTLMAMFVPAFILQGLYAPKWYGRVFCWLCLPLVLDSMVNTYRRGVFLSLVAEVAILIILLPGRVRWKIIPLVAFGGFFFLFYLTPETYWQRQETILTPEQEASANSRILVTEASIKMIQDYPMGVGYRNYPYVSPNYLPVTMLTYDEHGVGTRAAHNTLFTVLCETGVLGFAVWLVAVGGTLLLYRGIRKRMDPANPSQLEIIALGFEVGLFGWLAGSWTDSLHEMDPAYWFIAFGIVLKRLLHKRSVEEPVAAEEEEPAASVEEEMNLVHSASSPSVK